MEKWYEAAAETEQFRYWQAFKRIQPWGPWRDNYHAAMIVSALFATNANGPQNIDPLTYILDTSDKAEQQSATSEEMLRAAGSAMGLRFVEAPVCPQSPT